MSDQQPYRVIDVVSAERAIEVLQAQVKRLTEERDDAADAFDALQELRREDAERYADALAAKDDALQGFLDIGTHCQPPCVHCQAAIDAARTALGATQDG